MADRYASFAHSAPGRALVKRLGLPEPPRLRRHQPGDPLVPGPVLVGAAPGGRLTDPVRKILAGAGVELRDPVTPAATGPPPLNAALIFDATGIKDTTRLRELYDFFQPQARALYRSGRVIVFGTPPAACADPREATAQRAVEGFVRSVGKEFGRGITAQLVQVAAAAENVVESTVRFLLSGRSAYVSGQVIRIGPAAGHAPEDWDCPLADKVALVTGAARGIGAAIARILARDGAHVVCLDVPAAGDALADVANDIGGTALQLDLTGAEAPTRVTDHISTRHVSVDIVVHNAGILRDKTLGKMTPEQWDAVLDVNLASQERINDALLADNLITNNGGRLIAVSSVAGLAGNRGQTNYATSKAGVAGLAESLAPVLAPRGITVNAVAPGFIETAMTARIPMLIREAGRRMNSMTQAGLPVDVAETIAWLASPGSAGITGNVVRVCGQSLLGA